MNKTSVVLILISIVLVGCSVKSNTVTLENETKAKIVDVNINGKVMLVEYISNVGVIDETKSNASVPDEEMAITIASIMFTRTYRDCLENEMPLIVSFDEKNNAWIVNGTLSPNVVGGTASITIEKDTGKVLSLFHTK